MYKRVNIIEIYTVCMYLYIHNKYTQNTCTVYYVNKTFILYVINRLAALVYIFNFIICYYLF